MKPNSMRTKSDEMFYFRNNVSKISLLLEELIEDIL